MKVYQILKRGLFTGVVLTFFLIACTSDQDANIPDVADIKVNLPIIRFEQLLLADTLKDAAGIQKLIDDHPAFSSVFFNHVMPGADDMLASSDGETRLENIRQWMLNPATRWMYDTVQHTFPNLDQMGKELTDAFTYAKYYFPNKETPSIYTTISGFGYFPFIYSEDSLRDGIGISLEMFLGDTFPYRKYTGINNAFSDYLTRSYNKDHVVKRTLDVWVDDLAGPPSGNRLLDIMIDNGKKLYVLKQLLPHANDTIIMDYSLKKLNWAIDNEKNVWYHFTAKDMLYSTSLKKIQKYIGPSPDSPGMPPEAPGNTASWLGWQIVKSYMKKHPDISLEQLLNLKDAQAILDQSGYRPPR